RCGRTRQPAEKQRKSAAPVATAPRASRPGASGGKRKAFQSGRQNERRRRKRPRGHKPSSTLAGHKAPPAVQKCLQQRTGPPQLLTTVETCQFPQLLSITVRGPGNSRDVGST